MRPIPKKDDPEYKYNFATQTIIWAEEAEKKIKKAEMYAQKFVDKVESGKVRSKETYADMLDLLKD